MFPDDSYRPKPAHSKKDSVLEILSVFARPIIVMPTCQDVRIPDDIRSQITTERLIHAMQDKREATATECMWYLSTVSLCAPLGSKWFRIYMHLFQNWHEGKNGLLPDFYPRKQDLSGYESDELKKLSSWLYEKSYEEFRKQNRKPKSSQAKEVK